MFGRVWAGDVLADADVIRLGAGQRRECGGSAGRCSLARRLDADESNGLGHAIKAEDDFVELVIDKPREQQPVYADCEDEDQNHQAENAGEKFSRVHKSRHKSRGPTRLEKLPKIVAPGRDESNRNEGSG